MITEAGGKKFYEKINFPNGEVGVRLSHPEHRKGWQFDLVCDLDEYTTVFDLLILNDAIRRADGHIGNLTIPYIPYSRQDRVTYPGEALSLAVVCRLINSIGAKSVIIHDPHSEVTPALLDNCNVVPQWMLFGGTVSFVNDSWLICPDAGASKKLDALAKFLGTSNLRGIIQCSKKRDPVTGNIVGTVVPGQQLDFKNCYIVDDICDGGATFTAIARCLRDMNAGKIILYVTHGFFTKGLKVFEGLIDEIYTAQGRVI